MLNIDGRVSKDNNDIAKKFNEFFSSVGPDLAKKIPTVSGNVSIYDTLPAPNAYSMFIEPCTCAEIITTVNNLQNSSGVGMDGF